MGNVVSYDGQTAAGHRAALMRVSTGSEDRIK
jgi:hypothetical protein